jgi:N4-gp56 family major capsid protein
MSLPTAASVVSSGLGGYPTVFYDRVGLDTLQSNLFFYPACELRPMPNMSGVAMQIFNYTKLAANTTAVTEGTPQSGQSLTQNTKTINLSNYADFISYSNKVVLTAISDTVAEGTALLAYRGALSVDNVISTAVDVAANGDSVANIDINDGSYMTAALARKASWQLRSKDVKPKAGSGLYFGIVHSLSAYDMVNDGTAGGFTDLQKYSEELASKNPALVGISGARVGNIGGTMWYESNAVTTEANWQSTSHTAYNNYTFGKDAFLASSLGKTELNQKNFSVAVRRFDQGNSIDVAGLIAAASMYNFFFGVVSSPDTANSINHFRRIRVESSIG